MSYVFNKYFPTNILIIIRKYSKWKDKSEYSFYSNVNNKLIFKNKFNSNNVLNYFLSSPKSHNGLSIRIVINKYNNNIEIKILDMLHNINFYNIKDGWGIAFRRYFTNDYFSIKQYDNMDYWEKIRWIQFKNNLINKNNG